MSVAERPQSVAAELGEAAARYVAMVGSLRGAADSATAVWLRERRQQGVSAFLSAGFPTTRDEAWRFTDVKPIARTEFALVTQEPSLGPNVVQQHLLGGSEQFCAVFLNGRFAPDLSRLAGLPRGIRIGGLRETCRKSPTIPERHLGRYAADSRSPFTALNSAVMDDGAFVLVPRGVVLDRPIHLLFLAEPQDGRPLMWHPRNLVVVEDGARVSLVESYAALREGVYWTNAVTELVIGPDANVDTYRIQQESDQSFHTATTQIHQDRGSVFSLVVFTFGAELMRHDISAVLDGEGAECTLDGLSLVRGRQHVDHHTILEHAKSHCTSWEYFNGVFDDRARGVFNGRIIVRPGAQKTDSKQTNNNLLLSPHARANSQPQLEIHADDVKCTHGATLGPIDEDHLFYLQSRGLSRADARQLLTYGFASEILNTVALAPLREAIDAVVQRRLSAGRRGPA